MKRPEPRGELSALLLTVLTAEPEENADALAALRERARALAGASEDILNDDDIQLTLFCLYELHYGGIDGVDDRWEWSPELLAARSDIEAVFEAELRSLVEVPTHPAATVDEVAATLFRMTGEDSGPSLSRYVAKTATDEQLGEFLVQRSIYQLKEADPHSWAIPRLVGRPKAALVEIQADEYGGGRPERMHAVLFARSLRGLGLDDSYGRYVDCVPAITLASVNMMSLFGLHRRLRGAISGHLAAFEMTSSIPNRLYGSGFRRHGYDSDVTWYFDEHVEADAVHEQIAGRDLAGALAESEPELLDDILFGAAACLAVDGMVGEHILSSWTAGRSSLRQPLSSLA